MTRINSCDSCIQLQCRSVRLHGYRLHANPVQADPAKFTSLTFWQRLLSVGFHKDFRDEWGVGVIDLLFELELRPEDVLGVQQPERLRFTFPARVAAL